MATVPVVECQKRALKMEAQLIALEGAIVSMRSAAETMQGQDGEAIRWQLRRLVNVHRLLSQDNERNSLFSGAHDFSQGVPKNACGRPREAKKRENPKDSPTSTRRPAYRRSLG
jgi:TolA-binding protein